MEHIFAAGLQKISTIGAVSIRRLVEHFGSFEAVWHATEANLKAARILGEKQIAHFLLERKTCQPEKELKRLYEVGGKLITFRDREYPSLLAMCDNAPAILACKGNGVFTEKSIAIVGTRKPTPYGVNACRLFSDEIAKQGITLVSGGARGIDSVCHQSGIVYSNTIAVLACGLDVIYPPENKKLFEQITKNGLLVTEYALGTRPLGRQFPARNRIISGLSKAVLVIEAARKSGTLITADFALEAGRDVFALPGSVFSRMSEGTHHLIRQGAFLAGMPQDILREYGWLKKDIENNHEQIHLTEEELLVFKCCNLEETIDMDSIIAKSRLHPVKASYVLLQLELKGLVQNIGNQQYIAKVKE